MQIIDLFSGIGGFSIAGHSLGWETLLFCEKEPFPQQVLQERFPGVQVFDDVCKLTGEEINGLIQPNRPIILTGGFPCQPFSVAGAREGTEDDRHLWPEMYRIIREIRPDYIIGENVPGLLSIEGGMVFEQVCLDLESEGYEVQAFVLPACATGAPHRRDRVWIVAHSNNTGRGNGFGSVSGENGEISEWYENAELSNTNANRVVAYNTGKRWSEGFRSEANISERRMEELGQKWSGIRNDLGTSGKSSTSQNSGSPRCLDGEYEQQGSFGEFGELGTGSPEWNPDGEDAGVTTNTQEVNAIGISEFKNTKWKSDKKIRTRLRNEFRSNGSSRITTHPGNPGHQGGEQPGTPIERPESGKPHRQVAKLHSGNYWGNWPSQSPFHSGYDGLSEELVRHIRTTLGEAGETPENIEAYLRKEANWLRKEAIKCAGNAIVPQVVLQVMMAIQEHWEKTRNI